MIGLDTNILVRYLAQDDPVESLLADKLIDSLSSEEPGFISTAVAVELVRVMQRFYSRTKQQTIAFLEGFLRSEELVIENANVVWQAVHAYSRASADFADCLIERSAHDAHCTHTVTFDRKAAKTAGMVLLDS